MFSKFSSLCSRCSRRFRAWVSRLTNYRHKISSFRRSQDRGEWWEHLVHQRGYKGLLLELEDRRDRCLHRLMYQQGEDIEMLIAEAKVYDMLYRDWKIHYDERKVVND